MLIAEDEPAMLSALTDKFKREGCVVVGAKDGEAALDLANKKSPTSSCSTSLCQK